VDHGSKIAVNLEYLNLRFTMPFTRLEEMLVFQKYQIGIIQRFLTNFKKLGKEKLARSYLTVRLELLENHWSQVFRTHYVLCKFENIADTEYTKYDIFSEAESQYLATKTKINDLMHEESVAESVNNKTCYHNEYQ